MPIHFYHYQAGKWRTLILFTLLIPLINGKTSPEYLEETLQNFELTSISFRPLHNNGQWRRVLVSFTAFGTNYIIPMQESPLPLNPNFTMSGSASHRADRMKLIHTTKTYTGEGDYEQSKITLLEDDGRQSVFGCIEIANDTLIIEPFADTNKTLVYRNSDIRFHPNTALAVDYEPATLQGFSMPKESALERYLPRKRNADQIRKTRCELKIVADYDFYHVIGNDNYAFAARYLVNLIERVNGIFTRVDWGIDFGGRRLFGLGFSIKEIKIFDKPTSVPLNHFNAFIPPNDATYFSAIELLKSFSVEEGTNSSCLTILISGKVFDMGILGMANIGQVGERGLCAKQPLNRTYMNTAVISVQRRSGLMITRVVDLVVAHELGHTWGSIHDDMFDPECQPPNSENGRYIMHESSNSGYDRNNYKFSPCSIRSIHRLLYSLAEKCFVEDQISLCGNGILEDNEQCDAGGRLSGGAPTDDPCCTNRCTLRSHAKCSPKHSVCCSSNCTYMSRSHMCQPPNTDECKGSAFCTGKDDKCPNPQPIEDGVECVEEGKCKSGHCVSFCENFSADLSPCICENVTESCLRCCRSHATKECQPVTPNRYLEEGAFCIQGQCHNNICEKKLTDAASTFLRFIDNFRNTSKSKIFTDYFVFVVVFVSLIIWCPCGAFIVLKDRQRQKQSAQEEQDKVVIVPHKKRVRRVP